MESDGERDERRRAIVTEALRRPPRERAEFLLLACAGDEALLQEVVGALADEQRAAPTEATQGPSAAPGHPVSIGPYRLLEKIGEGGMAEVWRGEQTAPVHRTVAIKLIKTGLDATKAMVARFESERQALALMDHPAIARIYDAGETPEGRPYFVMEYVPGMPITEYCDKYRLSTRERLELFAQVCEGVQHAHQKAIIHRDLKPSNVLISVQDSKPAPKIIDFGVAKALAQRLTERTMFTEMGVLVGTPEYMSPEQAEMTGQNVDTRTDVYSLGLILYELLVGTLPFDTRELRRAGFAEILRQIREEDPPRPSTKIRTLGEASAISARNRKTEPRLLVRQLQGDLDWIVMKALEKDRTRRYGSPSDLAAELSRYLRDEPVLATPPSLAYRAGKFVRRHRSGVTVAAGVMLLLLGFAITVTLQARRIARERDRANREAEVSGRVKDFLTGLFKVSDPGEARGNSITAREILDRGAKQVDSELSAQPEIQAQLMETMGAVYKNLGLLAQAQPLLERAVETRRRVLGPEHRDTLTAIADLARLDYDRGHYKEAEKLIRPARDILHRTLGPNDVETFKTDTLLAGVLAVQGHGSEGIKIMEEMLPRERSALGPDHDVTLESSFDLAIFYRNDGRGSEAGKLFREVAAARRRVLGPEHPSTLYSMALLGVQLLDEKHYPDAEQQFREVLEIQQRVLGKEHPNTVRSMKWLGDSLVGQKRYPEGEEALSEALEIRRRILGPEHMQTIETIMTLGEAYQKDRRYADADKLYREALAISRRGSRPNRSRIAAILYELAGLAAVQGRQEAAFAGLREALDGGYRGADEMAKDEDLKSLRGDPRFAPMLAEVKAAAGK